jgi:hydrogenase maturation protein HypF
LEIENWDLERRHLHVTGVVQGVGFRPFVYTLAKRLALAGWVLNNSQGVDIEIEGAAADLDRFQVALQGQAPPLARLESVTSVLAAATGEADFTIRESQSLPGATLVSPDVCICDDCRRELFDPHDRRHLYPFINCTNCGPRFTIIQDVPYDRPLTTMRVFPMCPDCEREYRDPTNRRFHAQPNACWACGPNVKFQTPALRAGASVSNVKQPDQPTGSDALAETRRWLADGKIVAVKGIGGFHLACDATNDDAVTTLRQRKGRVGKPFALMMPDVETIERFCELSQAERDLLTSRQRPIVLVRTRPHASISPLVAPGQDTLGVMLPYSPLHYLLLSSGLQPPTFNLQPPALVMTSGNYSEEPIATRNDEALERLATLADAFLLHNRDIHARCDDSVTRVFAGVELPLRRSRGYAPYPVKLAMELRPTLACGGELKNTFCLANGRHAFLSPHIGDLENYETLASYEAMLDSLKHLFRVEPEIIAHDLHPDYLSTRYATRSTPPASCLVHPVQHHHAHIAACMAENSVGGPVIGVTLDGTGYGTDGRIWGGEFLIADFSGFTRAFHLEYLPLPGGEAAIHKPWRIATGYAEALGLDIAGLPFLQSVSAKELRVCRRQAAKGLNAPLTSSMGRLFDCVAALANVRTEVTYEGQAAMELEQISNLGTAREYAKHQISNGKGYLFGLRAGEISLKSLLAEVIEDVRRGVRAGEIGAKFHRTIAEMILAVCERIQSETGLREVALSGGVFQNVTLLGLTVPRLRDAGFTVYTHSLVPPNDGGLALGQAVIANVKSQTSQALFEI